MGLFDLVKSWLGVSPEPKKKPRKKSAKKPLKKRSVTKSAKRKRKKPKESVRKNKKKLPKNKKKIKPVKKTAGLKSKKKVPTPKRKSKSLSKEREVGVVTHYFPNISVGIINLKGVLRIGRKIRFKGAHGDFVQPVDSMQMNHRDIVMAGRGAEIGIKVIARVHPGDKVYIAED
ncbi:MAG: hypothetical protein JXD21_08700 [Candidatus Omnitrophica bacterium]|nr:hypothetical protein [Candidatus Omnitrophota bacterium]